MQQTAQRQEMAQPPAVASSSTFLRIKRVHPSLALWRISLQGWVWVFFLNMFPFLPLPYLPHFLPLYYNNHLLISPCLLCLRNGQKVQSPWCLPLLPAQSCIGFCFCVTVITGIWIDPYLPVRQQNNSLAEASRRSENSAAICYYFRDLAEQ